MVIGKNHKGALATLVDQHSKFSLIAKVFDKSANNATDTIITMFSPVKERIHTIIFDIGKEFVHHQKMSDKLDVDIFYTSLIPITRGREG